MTAPVAAASAPPQPAGIRRSSRYLPELEALRGIAITLVFFHHAAGMLEPPAAGGHIDASLPWAYVAAGGTGVTLFFVLSGFLLSLPFLAEAGGGPHVGRRQFYLRRGLRIVPVYYAAVLLVALLAVQNWIEPRHFVARLLFLNWYTSKSLFPFSSVWWSLGTEVQFYLVLPLLPLALRMRRVGLALGVAYLVAYALFLSQLVTLSREEYLDLSHSLLGVAPAFGFGILAAAIYQHAGTHLRTAAARSPILRNGGAEAIVLVILLLLGRVLQWLVHYGFYWAEFGVVHTWHLAEALLWTALLMVLLLAPLRLKPLLSNRVWQQLGVWSYSIYLLHLPLLVFAFRWLRQAWPERFVGWNITTVTTVGVLALLCVALSSLTYGVIERPFLVRKARVYG